MEAASRLERKDGGTGHPVFVARQTLKKNDQNI